MAFPINPDDPGGPGGTGGGGGTGTSTGTNIFDVTFTKDLADSTLRVLVYASLSSPDDIIFSSYIVLDGTTVQVGETNMIFARKAAKVTVTPFAYLEGIAAGEHNIKFSIRNREDDGYALTLYVGATIEITELKRGAR